MVYDLNTGEREPVIFWRQQFVDPDFDRELAEMVATDFTGEEDMTLQQYKDETDINEILRRFGITGEMSVAERDAYYGDFTVMHDYHTTLETLREAQAKFDALPAKLRERFSNDPGALIDFIRDPANVDEARKLGLLPAKPQSEVEPPPPTPAPTG